MCWLLLLCASLLATAAQAGTVWLDELDLTGMTAGALRPRARLGWSGTPLSIAGGRCARGVGTHAVSRFTLDLRGRAQRFVAQVGIDDGRKDGPGSAEFQVWGDGRVLWHSGVMATGQSARDVAVDLAGVQRLELLVTDGGDGISSDHADWAEARLEVTDPMADLYPGGADAVVPTSEWNRLTSAQVTAGWQLTAVAPGVWRLRLGRPEAFVPTRFAKSPDHAGLDAVGGETERLPLRPAAMTFTTSARGCTVELPLANHERIFGCGLSLKLFDLTDRRVVIRTSDAPEGEQNDSHSPVPFYLSTAGYGVFVDTARYASFYAGNVARKTTGSEGTTSSGTSAAVANSTAELYRARALASKAMVVDVPAAQGVDIYLFAGPSLREVVRRYNLFSGGGVLPPLWGLGIQYRGAGSFTADESLKLAESFREAHMPCDGWGLEPGWQSQAYSCSFVWSPERFPHPEEFVRKMRALGYHLSLWEHAFTHPSSPLHTPLKAHSGDYLVWNGLVPDFADPDARRIFGGYHARELVAKGIETFKLDECDNQPLSATPWSWPEATHFPSGIDGEQMHGLLGVLYQQTLADSLHAADVRTFGLARASHGLAAPLPYAIYSDAYDHANYLRALVKTGFGGLLWVPEVRDAGSVEELYRRLQTVIVSPQALVNCWYMRNPPWLQIDRDKSNRGELMADHEQVTATVRRLFGLRMSLVPYLYSAFAAYRETGLPPFRALLLDWPDDPTTWTIDDQLMLGPSIMAAPLVAGQKQRKLYLPAGVWYDWWSNERYNGPLTLTIAPPIDRLPLYVRGGALLPLAKPVEQIGPETCFDLTVTSFGGQPQTFELYEDDGHTFAFERGEQNRVTLRWDGQRGSLKRAGGYKGPERYRVVEWRDLP